jgi:hypothetical protein
VYPPDHGLFVTGNCNSEQSLWANIQVSFVIGHFEFFIDGVRCLFQNSVIPWSRVLLEKLTATQQLKKFPAFYGTRKFIAVFTRACDWSLS